MKQEHSAKPAAIMGVAFAAVFGLVALADPPIGATANAGLPEGQGIQELQPTQVLQNETAALDARAAPTAESNAPTVRLADGAKWPTDTRTVERLKLVAKDLGKTLIITSGKRDLGSRKNPKPGTQWYFWKKYVAGRGNLAAYPNPNAPHIKGYAADVLIEQPDGTRTNVGEYVTGRRILRKHGLVLSVRTEGWHVAPKEVNSWAYRP